MKPTKLVTLLSGGITPAFNPLTDVADPSLWKFWVEANSGLYQDTGKTAPATANNDVVGAWVDQVAGHDALQATAGSKPLLKTNFVGSTPALFFDGVNDKLVTSAFNSGIGAGGEYTLFISAMVNSDGSNHAALGMGAGLAIYLLGTAGSVYMFGGNWREFNQASNSDAHIYTFARPSSTGRTRLYVDDVLDAADDAVNIDVAVWGNQTLTIGEAGEGNFPFSGYVFAVGLYAGLMSAGDLTATNNYYLGKLL